MAKEVFHNTLLSQSSLSDETVNLIDVCNSISLLTAQLFFMTFLTTI